MKRLKLLPTLREKKRYLLIQIKSSSREKINVFLLEKLLEWLGIIDYAKAGPRSIVERIKQINQAYVHYLILQVNRVYTDQVKSFLLFFPKAECLLVSGCINKVKSKLNEKLKQERERKGKKKDLKTKKR